MLEEQIANIMATITFTNGSIKQVHPTRALRLWFVQQGLKPSTPELTAYLKTVRKIEFQPTLGISRKERLPYND